MKTHIKKNDKRRMLIFIPALLLMAAILCVSAMTIYRGVSERTVTNISGVYLREMTAQLSSHFQTNLTASFLASTRSPMQYQRRTSRMRRA